MLEIFQLNTFLLSQQSKVIALASRLYMCTAAPQSHSNSHNFLFIWHNFKFVATQNCDYSILPQWLEMNIYHTYYTYPMNISSVGVCLFAHKELYCVHMAFSSCKMQWSLLIKRESMLIWLPLFRNSLCVILCTISDMPLLMMGNSNHSHKTLHYNQTWLL